MSSVVHQVQVLALVMLPATAKLEENLIVMPDGQRYSLGPALYKVQPVPAGTYSTILADIPGATEQMSTEYLPYESWPQGLELDNAVSVAFSPPIPTETRN